ncbi:hybrid sensor histidine kinase/response regulator [Paraburkholderia fungorum]|uniref:hybrid sensor histidine kinase/response regulator n=1 Tax=Paraburkholderia fungorum TaxID=134537 RepID=UPI0038B8030B
MRPDNASDLAKLSDAQRLELLVTSVRDYAIYMLDPRGTIVSWNTGAERFKGYLAKEVIGQHFSLFYTDADRQAGLPDRVLRMAAEAGKFEAEGWRVRKDGTRFWAHVVIDPITNDAGQLIGYAKVTRDITERKAAQEALRKSEEQFRLLVQGVTDYAIYMLSPEGEVSSWNAGATRIKGYERAEIVGRHFSCFYTGEDQVAGVPATMLAIASKEGRVEREGWRVRKDGTRFWAHVVVDAIRNEDGALVGFAKITRDITERKEAATAIERANLALFQSQKMEAIGQLTGGVAHDFNNLLAVLSNGLQVLSTQSRTHLDAKMIQSMQRAIERGASLTQQLLSFARQQPLKPERHDLNALIRDFEPMLRRAGSSSVRIELAMSRAETTALVDAPRFEAALLNLVVNACDAMPDGGSVIVSTECVEVASGTIGNLPGGSYVRVCVTDSGTGMSPEVASRAFEPFYTTKETGKGTGLGLSQVYGFITQSGGDVRITSTEGVGTAIDLYLPIAGASAPGSRDGLTPFAAETVLLVEDDPDLLSGATELFRSIGYEVVAATDAAQAAGILESRTDIDILFSDIVMPHGVSGVELARRVRARYPGVRIVLTSAYPMAALRRDNGDIDEFVFVHKPYRLSDVARAMRA